MLSSSNPSPGASDTYPWGCCKVLMDVAAPRTPGGDWSQFCFTPCEQGRCPLGAELCSLVWGCPEHLGGVCLGVDYLCRWKAGLASMGWHPKPPSRTWSLWCLRGSSGTAWPLGDGAGQRGAAALRSLLLCTSKRRVLSPVLANFLWFVMALGSR